MELFNCNKCTKTFKKEDYFKKHLWEVHNIGEGEIFYCAEKDCEYKTKRKESLLRHINIHEKEDDLFYCDKKNCNYKSKQENNLKQHLWKVHNVGEEKIFYCKEKDCEYKSNQKINITRHLWLVHNIGEGEIFYCGEKKCKFDTKNKQTLEKHLWNIHNIGKGEIFYCDEKDCKYQTKQSSHLKQHMWEVHNIGKGKVFYCDEKDCKYQTKQSSHLKQHMWEVHNIGNGDIFYCDKIDCEFSSKRKEGIIKHMWQIHNIGNGEIFNCKYCQFSSKQKSSLKIHLSNIHDIGDKVCDYCYGNMYYVIKYNDDSICRKCYNKKTGYNTRIEKDMVEYLKSTDDIGEYFVLENKVIKGELCDTKRRPDLVISSTSDLYIIIECDEEQHKYNIPECENGRIDEILDEIPDGRKVFIRWNPDKYKSEGKNITKKTRLKLLKNLILYITSKEDWKDNENILVYYMFYDTDNPVITHRWLKKLIYTEGDF